MTYAEALAEYKSSEYYRTHQRDKPAIRMGWVETIDQLHRSRQITDEQAQEWDNPF